MMEYCRTCERDFVSQVALVQHWRDSSRHAYCPRCERPFDSKSALQQHRRDSARHHVCHICSPEPDFSTFDDFNQHREQAHHYCPPCHRFFQTADRLKDHDISEHNMCETCGKYNNSYHNLRAHARKHDAKSLECFCCTKKFASYSAMVLHLERGSCEADVDEDDIIEIALECYQSRHYECHDGEHNVECPTCETPFPAMSGLLQHVESDACGETLAAGTPLWKFLRFLDSRI